ncbi:MAG: valine--tRNA ligase [Candidatus Zixiibacteriota bacterium]|nr:MAG: valine--tRNA ligase [candidate division Zixibacteria bacterium]
MTKKIPKAYEPKKAEEVWYPRWEQSGMFHGDPDSERKPFSIVIPPPNVTDILHLGHALNNTLQDILIRWKRSMDFEVEWMPGVDHAGIATQVVVEKNLTKEGKSRQELGREKFLKKVWDWKEEKFDMILNQLKRIGCSCDWERKRFTMDEGLSRAVKEVFIRLYEKGLIYRGNRLINWCPRCLTTLSDDELEREDIDTHLWYIKYKIKGSDRYITVATTRPETMLGDTGVAVNPKDKRFRDLVGKSAILPILDRELPIITDDYVDTEFGTGAVKVTPAHDPNDFEIGDRHNLEKLNILNDDGSLNDNAGKFSGMDRFAARKKLVEELKEHGYLEKIEDHKLAVATCYRCETVVEPYLSIQWFVKMQPLAKPAVDALKSGELKFHPAHWSKTYLYWLENIRDWCISRQLWWGHRIPAYYCKGCGEIIVSGDTPKECPKCKSSKIEQDPDVLDTWFSSWLWPFSTFGWPEDTPEIRKFFPTKALFTASEIIYLWVARMIMASYEFTGKIPFNDVYIHGTVRDELGEKMSKSKGNGIDPLEIIDKFGADALRVSMILATPEGQDPLINEKSFEIGRNYANKIWNAARFVITNLNGFDHRAALDTDPKELELPDIWILSRLAKTIGQVNNYLSGYRFNTAARTAYDFIWKDYCDWYLEMIKPRLAKDRPEEVKNRARMISGYVLVQILRLLHPFMPFVTEEIYHILPDVGEDEFLNSLGWPVPPLKYMNDDLEKDFELVQNVIGAIRNIRAEMDVPPGKKADVLIKIADNNMIAILENQKTQLITLGKIENLTIGKDVRKPPLSASAVISAGEIYIPLEGLIDLESERGRLEKELQKQRQYLERIKKKLANADFLNRAPSEVIEAEKEKKTIAEESINRLNKNLESLAGW